MSGMRPVLDDCSTERSLGERLAAARQAPASIFGAFLWIGVATTLRTTRARQREARAVLYAISQASHADINKILIPTRSPSGPPPRLCLKSGVGELVREVEAGTRRRPGHRDGAECTTGG
jgi:hypothetical protein